jgi:hypothetical protein
MSVSLHRVWLSRATDVLIATAILTSGACHRTLSTAPQPSVAAPSTGEAGFRRFPGVDLVTTSRSGFAVRIHSGMVGDGDPLYVIDGAPMKIAANRGIDWFRPEDIAEIKVLKYPHELAEYGPSGVNGVIVITTKLAAGQSRR